MCGGGGSKKAPKPVVTPQANPNAVADTSNDAQRRAAVVASTDQQPTTFGSELGAQ
jgi:hypothetical protein